MRNKKVGYREVATILIFVVSAFVLFTVVASATDIYVGPDETYKTIQSGVTAASSGDTIIVRDGTYNENVDVNVSHLTIRSENGSANCIVNASNSNDHVFDVTKDYVNVSGFTVTGATGINKAGIYLSNADHCNISDNSASNTTHGIWLDSSSNNTLSNNNASNNWDGICLYSSSNNNTLMNNNASDNGIIGIYLSDSSNNTLTNSIASNNTHGIWLDSSSNNTLTNSIASDNDGDGICLYSSSNYNTLMNNNASDNGNIGIYLYSSSNYNTLMNNNASDNGNIGIYLYSSSNNNTLQNNIASDNDAYGIMLDSSSNNTLTNNNASGNAHGIMLDYSSNNTLTNNTANSNDDYGILLSRSSNNTLTNNTANSNDDYGILLSRSSNNTLTNNTANSNDGDGIYLWGSSNSNTLTGNTASNNTEYDFFSDQNSHNNTVEDLTIASYPTTVSFTYDNGVGIKGVDTAPGDPAEKANIGKYVNATKVTADSWLFLNVSYTDADLGGVDEDSLRMWRYNGTDWTEVPAPNDVNTIEKYVYANITSFSIFAPLGNVTPTPPPVPVPEFNAVGLLALIGILSVVLAVTLRRK